MKRAFSLTHRGDHTLRLHVATWESISFHLTSKEICLYIMLLKSDHFEEAIWGPQNVLITWAILLCYYHNYPFAPKVLIRNSSVAPPPPPWGGGVKRARAGGMLKLGKGVSQLLPYASERHVQKGRRTVCAIKRPERIAACAVVQLQIPASFPSLLSFSYLLSLSTVSTSNDPLFYI